MTKLGLLVKEHPELDKWMSKASNFILGAEALKHRGKLDIAIEKYKEAAEIEWQLYKFLREYECKEDALDSLISCGSCWYDAGNFETAKAVFSWALAEAADEQTKKLCWKLIDKTTRALSSPPEEPSVEVEEKGKLAHKLQEKESLSYKILEPKISKKDIGIPEGYIIPREALERIDKTLPKLVELLKELPEKVVEESYGKLFVTTEQSEPLEVKIH